jgi:glutamate synthase (NADPH/NADH) small chain
VELVTTELGEADDSGRRRPVVVPNSWELIAADMVLIAFGFRPDPPDWLKRHGIELNSWGGVITGQSPHLAMQTTNEKFFAGGDMVRGSDLVVTAIWEGRQAAKGILKFLEIEQS